MPYSLMYQICLMALPVLPGGVTKGLTIVNNSLETQSNFNAEQALYSIIDGANLAEFEVGLMSAAKKKTNTKKFG